MDRRHRDPIRSADRDSRRLISRNAVADSRSRGAVVESRCVPGLVTLTDNAVTDSPFLHNLKARIDHSDHPRSFITDALDRSVREKYMYVMILHNIHPAG